MSDSNNTTQIEDPSVPVLYIWPGDWDLESVDADCLVALVN